MKIYHDSTPRLLSAKFNSTCSACSTSIKKGDEILYYPQSKKVECRTCATSTLDALADERNF